MECVICKNGTTEEGLVSLSMEKNAAIIVFKNVPALICNNCGDYYLTEETTKILLEKASRAFEKGVEFEIINFKTAA